MVSKMPDATMVLIDKVGHCPQLSAAGQSADAIFPGERFPKRIDVTA